MKKVLTALCMGLLAWSAAMTTACAQEDQNVAETVAEEAVETAIETAEETAEESTDAVSEEAPAELEMAGIEEPEASAVMGEALDGSSVENFKAGLKNVEEKGTPEEYRQLRGAIAHMITYNPRYRGDLPGLYKSLDGKSPTEIIANSGMPK